MAGPADEYLRHFESLKIGRAMFDAKRQMVSDYILPRRDFSVTQRGNTLRPHRVTSSIATNANSRMAAWLLTYWIDFSRPWLRAALRDGVMHAGRGTGLSDPAITYLDSVGWILFNALMRPKARLMTGAASMLKEFCAFGDGVLWSGRRRGFGPYIQTRSIQTCWWAQNEEGVTDTLHHKIMRPRYRVEAKWPDAAKIWDTPTGATNEQDEVELLIVTRPRAGGRRGVSKLGKSFEHVVIVLANSGGTIVEESGFDSFPWHIFSYDPMPGNVYGEGPGCQVLPDVMVLNHLQQAIEDCASQKAFPPIAMPARMFGAKPLDRRPGAVQHYNPTALGLIKAQDALLKLDFTGDPTASIDLMKELAGNIENGFFSDWQNLREAGDMTAEEVNERRDIRLRGAASIVGNLEEPSSLLGDRVQEILTEEGFIPPPPQELSGKNVDWEFQGPLKTAQLSGNVRAALQWINAAGLVRDADPAAAQAADLEETLRVIHEGLGMGPNTLNSKGKVQQYRQDQAKAAEQQHYADLAGKAAAAVKDGGAGAASMMAANLAQQQGQGGGAPGGAPFGQVNPFAQPVAA
jgi:hypothetical protein